MSNAPYALGPPLVPTVVTLPSWLFQSAPALLFAKLPLITGLTPPLVPVPTMVALTAVGAVPVTCVAYCQ